MKEADGWVFFAIAATICILSFLNGLRFARMTSNPWAGRKLFGSPVGGSDLPIERIRLFGWMLMIAAPLFLLFFAALSFGLLGPIEGIRTTDL